MTIVDSLSTPARPPVTAHHDSAEASELLRTPAMQPGVHSQELPPQRLLSARFAYTTRYVAERIAHQPSGFSLRRGDGVVPRAGDAVLARVTELGHHKRLESPTSRRQRIFPGHEVLVAYGHRYAPDQFLAHVPDSLEPCALVAGGGIAARVEQTHARINAATQLEPIGLLCDETGPVTLAECSPHHPDAVIEERPSATPRVIAVVGSSMNSGKSTTVGCLVNGLSNAGLEVAAGKVTGTGSGNDINLFRDAGAGTVMDFTDFGLSTTFKADYDLVCRLLTSMIAQLAEGSPEVIVLEIADGVFQAETERLLNDPLFHRHVDTMVFAAQEALGAMAGAAILREAGMPASVISGVVTASPLAAAEAGGQIPEEVVPTFDLCRAEVAQQLLGQLQR